MSRSTRAAGLASLCAVALMTAACGGSDDSSGADDSNTITWWHNSNNEPGKGYYEQVAKDFEADHPGIDVQVSAMAHEDMVEQARRCVPERRRPGHLHGARRRRARRPRRGGARARPVRRRRRGDRDARRQRRGMAGRTAGPTPCRSPSAWSASGTTRTSSTRPASRHRRPRWTSSTTWSDSSRTPASRRSRSAPATSGRPRTTGTTRRCARAPRRSWRVRSTSLDFSDPCFVEAGEALEDIVGCRALQPGLPDHSRAGGGHVCLRPAGHRQGRDGAAGHWEPGVMQGLTDDGKGLGEKTGWFAFPAVEGGAGDPAAQLGGGDAWAVAESAPDEAVDLVTLPAVRRRADRLRRERHGPADQPGRRRRRQRPGARGAARRSATTSPYVQLYFDTAFGTSVGGAMNDEIALLFSGDATPQEVVDATQQAADQEQ